MQVTEKDNAPKAFWNNYFMMETSGQLNEIILDKEFRDGEAAVGKIWR